MPSILQSYGSWKEADVTALLRTKVLPEVKNDYAAYDQVRDAENHFGWQYVKAQTGSELTVEELLKTNDSLWLAFCALQQLIIQKMDAKLTPGEWSFYIVAVIRRQPCIAALKGDHTTWKITTPPKPVLQENFVPAYWQDWGEDYLDIQHLLDNEPLKAEISFLNTVIMLGTNWNNMKPEMKEGCIRPNLDDSKIQRHIGALSRAAEKYFREELPHEVVIMYVTSLLDTVSGISLKKNEIYVEGKIATLSPKTTCCLLHFIRNGLLSEMMAMKKQEKSDTDTEVKDTKTK
jgi:hypothetical protein